MKIKPLLPDIFFFENFRIVLKMKRKQLFDTKTLKSFVFAFTLLLNASMVYSFEMPTPTIYNKLVFLTESMRS